MLNSIPSRVRVYKAHGLGCDHCRPVLEKPWHVSAPYWGSASFATWREAMDHALTWRPPMMWNGIAPELQRRPVLQLV